MQNREIERKWLLDAFPELPYEQELVVEQGYLAFQPVAVRIRCFVQPNGGKTGFYLTVKGRGTLTRTEVETPITADQYAALEDILAAPPATKRLRTYRLAGGQVLECSLVDEGEDTAFYYAEVEFETEEQAKSFVPPEYLGKEVTEDPDFTMAAYCRRKAEAL